MNSDEKSNLYLVDIKQSEIELIFQEIITELNNKVFIFTNKYWKYVYLDRFFKIIISITSMISVMILSFDVAPFKLDENGIYSAMTSLYIVYSLIMTNLICVVIMSSLKVRVKCVYHNTLANLYKNRLAVIKKKISNPMTTLKIHELYEKTMLQLNTIENYEESYQMR